MGKIIETLVRDGRIYENYRSAKSIIEAKYIRKVEEHTGKQKVLDQIRKKLRESRIYINNSNSRNNATYFTRENKVVIGVRGQAFTNEKQLELILHELAHLVQFTLYPKSSPHGKEFKSICRIMGYPQIGKASMISTEEMYEDKEYFQKEVEKRKEEKVADYKYLVVCKDCNKILKGYMKKSKVVMNPSKYRSKCCSGKLRVEEIRG